MLEKSGIGNAQAMSNQRNIMLADYDPKVVGGELRQRLTSPLKDNLVSSQWGDGFGAASCELAHPAFGG